MSQISRKKFLTGTATGLGCLLSPALLARPAQGIRPAGIDMVVVKEFVTVAHKDMDKVKTMLQETPDLLNVSYNWKDWDWEDAIGAAGHMGLRDLALYLLDQGARPTICVAAMLGKTDVVRSFITAFPAMKDALGPHRISLVRHAKAGGEPAKETLAYLQDIGAKE